MPPPLGPLPRSLPPDLGLQFTPLSSGIRHILVLSMPCAMPVGTLGGQGELGWVRHLPPQCMAQPTWQRGAWDGTLIPGGNNDRRAAGTGCAQGLQVQLPSPREHPLFRSTVSHTADFSRALDPPCSPCGSQDLGPPCSGGPGPGACCRPRASWKCCLPAGPDGGQALSPKSRTWKTALGKDLG